jgi:homoserine O-acetyltransferase/O-succinyltransferase
MRREIYDPSAGLGLIQARLRAVNSADDELNPVELGGLERAIAQVNRVTPSRFRLGRTPAATEVWQDHVRQLLHETKGPETINRARRN